MIKELLDLLSLGYYSKYRNNRVLLKQSSLMHEFGLEILDLFHRISLEQKKAIWLEFGTLLGAYRNHSFRVEFYSKWMRIHDTFIA